MKCLLAVWTLWIICKFADAQQGGGDIQNFGQCTTPNRERGLCIYLDQCSELYDILTKKNSLSADDRTFLRNSQCGYNNNKVLVCCARRSLESTQSRNPSNVPRVQALLPQPGVCGSVISQDRIYGGNITHIDEFPWMALIEYTKPGNSKGFHCGGSLINNRYVITASHCVNKIPSSWRLTGVRLGEWDTSTDTDCERDSLGNSDCSEPPIDVAVEKIIPHEDYVPNSRGQSNDIALLRLSRSVRYTNFIKPICLPSAENLQRFDFEGIKMDVAGWGKTEMLSKSDVKLKASVSGVSFDQCQARYKPHNIELENSQMCAGGEKGIDSCRGDSGGPLIGLDRTVKTRVHYFLVGIVSFGPTPCGLEGWPGVYTRVASFVDWISRNIQP